MAQSTEAGSAGNGYSITPFGKLWLAEAAQDIFVPTEPERFGELLAGFRQQFGPGFHQRGQEAVRCYGAHAYLACCAMCGAAIESILLALAVAKKKNEPEVLKLYGSAGGRGKIENLLIGTAKANFQTQFKGLAAQISYWRDEAAHGKVSQISDIEAYISLNAVLRFALFARDHWTPLTGM